MTTERDERGSTNGQKHNPQVMQAVIEALATGDRESVLKVLRASRPADSKVAALVSRANLDSTQEALLNVFLGLEQGGTAADPDDEPTEKAAVPITGELPELERELLACVQRCRQAITLVAVNPQPLVVQCTD